MNNTVHIVLTQASRDCDFAQFKSNSRGGGNCLHLNWMYSPLIATKSTTHLLSIFSDGYTFTSSRTEEMFVSVSVQGLIRFPMCCLALAMCEGAAAAASMDNKIKPNMWKPNRCHTRQQPTHTRHEPQTTNSLLNSYLMSPPSSWQE